MDRETMMRAGLVSMPSLRDDKRFGVGPGLFGCGLLGIFAFTTLALLARSRSIR
jgi:hypothetical protein